MGQFITFIASQVCQALQHESFLSFSTDEPKPPGPVELEQVVYDKIIITWAPSPDQEKDNRLYYLVDEPDSNTRAWSTKPTVCFATLHCLCPIQLKKTLRVYAKNYISDPSKSPMRGINELRGGLQKRTN